MNWQALWEGIKEPLRLLVLAIVSYLIINVLPNVSTTWVVPLTFLLRFIDSWLHELGKATDSERLTRGLTQF